ncbi:hypothetical protein O3P69_006164 [Scylla paramamosain]|uniref:Uncharacterized protein n=1 Tax=Scylla paramamosain TaxID=85552 RepID=A0AAW0U8Z2_SCYPA
MSVGVEGRNAARMGGWVGGVRTRAWVGGVVGYVGSSCGCRGSPQAAVSPGTSLMKLMARAALLLLLLPLLPGTLATPTAKQKESQVRGGGGGEGGGGGGGGGQLAAGWSGDRPVRKVSAPAPSSPSSLPELPTPAIPRPLPLPPQAAVHAARTKRSITHHTRRLHAPSSPNANTHRGRRFRPTHTGTPPQTKSLRRSRTRPTPDRRAKNNKRHKKERRKKKVVSAARPAGVGDTARASYVISDITDANQQKQQKEAPFLSPPARSSDYSQTPRNSSNFDGRPGDGKTGEAARPLNQATLKSLTSRHNGIIDSDTIVKDGQIFHRHDAREDRRGKSRGQSRRRHARRGDQLAILDETFQRDVGHRGMVDPTSYFTAEALNRGGHSQTRVAGNMRGVDGSAVTLSRGKVTQAAVILGENSSSRAQVTDHHGADDPVLASTVGADQRGGSADARARAPDAATTHAQIEFTPTSHYETELGEHGTASALSTPDGESTIATLGGQAKRGSYLGTAHSSTLQENYPPHHAQPSFENEGTQEQNAKNISHVLMDMSDMVDSIMETVHQPDLPQKAAHLPPDTHRTRPETKVVPAKEGLVGGNGDPPKESEIGRVSQQEYQEQERGGSQVVPQAAGQVDSAAYYQGQRGTPPEGSDWNGLSEDYRYNPSMYYNFDYPTDYRTTIDYDAPYLDLDPKVFHVQPLELDLNTLYPTPAPPVPRPHPDQTEGHSPAVVHQLQTTTPALPQYQFVSAPDQPNIPDYSHSPDHSQPDIPDYSHFPDQLDIPDYSHSPDHSQPDIPDYSYSPDHSQPDIPDYSHSPDHFQPDIPDYSRSPDQPDIPDYSHSPDHSQPDIPDYSHSPDHSQPDIPDYSHSPDHSQPDIPDYSHSPDHSQPDIPDYSHSPDHSQPDIPDYSHSPDHSQPEYSHSPDYSQPDIPDYSHSPDQPNIPDYSHSPDHSQPNIPDYSHSPDYSQPDIPDYSHSPDQPNIPDYSHSPDHSQPNIPDYSHSPDYSQPDIPDYSHSPDQPDIPDYSHSPDHSQPDIPDYSHSPDHSQPDIPDYSHSPDHSQPDIPDYSHSPDYSQPDIPDYSRSPDQPNIPDYSHSPDHSQPDIPDYSHSPDYSQPDIPDYSQPNIPDYSHSPDQPHIPDYSQPDIPDYSHSPYHSQPHIPDYSHSPDQSNIPDYSHSSGHSQPHVPQYSHSSDWSNTPDYSHPPDHSQPNIPDYFQDLNQSHILDYSQPDIPYYSDLPDHSQPDIPDYTQPDVPDYSHSPDHSQPDIPYYSQSHTPDYSHSPDHSQPSISDSQTPDQLPISHQSRIPYTSQPHVPDQPRVAGQFDTPPHVSTPGLPYTSDPLPDHVIPDYSRTPDHIPDYSPTPDQPHIPDYSQSPGRPLTPDHHTPHQPSVPASFPSPQQHYGPGSLPTPEHSPAQPSYSDQRETNQPSIPRPSGSGVFGAAGGGRDGMGSVQTMAMGVPLVPGEPGSSQILPNGEGGPILNVITMPVNHGMDTSVMQRRPGAPIQPGQNIPGAPGYKIPAGFRGRIILGHVMPAEGSSRFQLEDFNTQMHLTPQSPASGTVFASVSSPQASQRLTSEGGLPGVHVTLGGGDHRQQYRAHGQHPSMRGDQRYATDHRQWDTDPAARHVKPSHRGQPGATLESDWQNGRGRASVSSTVGSWNRNPTNMPSKSWNGRHISQQQEEPCTYITIVCRVMVDNLGNRRQCRPSYNRHC